MYYPTGGIFDYVFIFVVIVTIVVVIILLYRFEKNRNDPKRVDKEYLRTLELPELRFILVGAKESKIIEEVIEEKIREIRKL